jgi:hypothetical protein
VNGTIYSPTQNIFLDARAYNFTANVSGYYNLTTEYFFTANSNTTITMTSAYNARLNVSVLGLNGALIKNLTRINITYATNSYSTSIYTVNGSHIFNLINGTFNVTVEPAGYAYYGLNFNQTNLVAGNNAINFTFYTTNSYSIYFRRESNLSLVNSTNITLEIISSFYANGNYSTGNGSLYLDLLIPGDYTFRYGATGYAEKFYYVTLQNNSHSTLTLYMTDNYSQVTFTISDEYNNLLQNAVVKAQRYNIITNSYSLVSECKTNIIGECKLPLFLNKEFYKILVEYPSGTLKYSGSGMYITDTSYSIQLQIGAEIGENYQNALGIDYSLVYNNNTKNFRFAYNDVGNVVTQGCLEIYKSTSAGKVLVNSSCAGGVSNTILIQIDNCTGCYYIAEGYVYIPDKYFLTTSAYRFPDVDLFGTSGLFYVILLTLVFMGMAHYSVMIAMVLTPVPAILASYIGIIDKSLLPIVLAFEIFAFIIGYAVNKSG